MGADDLHGLLALRGEEHLEGLLVGIVSLIPLLEFWRGLCDDLRIDRRLG